MRINEYVPSRAIVIVRRIVLRFVVASSPLGVALCFASLRNWPAAAGFAVIFVLAFWVIMTTPLADQEMWSCPGCGRTWTPREYDAVPTCPACDVPARCVRLRGGTLL